MNRILSTCFFLSIFFFAQAQSTYFQQEVNSKIKVSLNDTTHTLTGDIEIEYTNNSPQTLHKIYMHLWPNAYSSKRTAFAKQQIAEYSEYFYFAPERDMGHISDINFSIDGQKINWQLIHPDTPDIAVITLPTPLTPNSTIIIHTPFTVKIPSSFSRLSHVKTSYQITQWYPKPAVYDRHGWHAMPYLDSGEFYSEFGNFDVTITLPENYVVGATGLLQTESEKEFLSKKIIETKAAVDSSFSFDNYPPSSPKTKTIRYTAQKVHDFAWFADKRFGVIKDTVQLQSGKIIDTWTMFPAGTNWNYTSDYIKRTILNYSNWVGEYPYPQATAVLNHQAKGVNMEYPMVTLIGRTTKRIDTDELIAHEVGHNWFYGILASNEREFPWMDEGMNSFYENRYMKKYYSKSSEDDQSIYRFFARKNLEKSINTPAEKNLGDSYWVGAYTKPALGLKMLEASVGRTHFDLTMKKYYETWKFKHPYPSDFRQIWEENTNINLDWFFDDYIKTTKKVDYKIHKIKELYDKTEITIINNKHLEAPLLLYAFQNNKAVDSIISEGFIGTKTFTFPTPKTGSYYDYFEIDPHGYTTDIYPKNNSTIKPKLALKLGIAQEKKNLNQISILPMYAWNEYDKNMVGFTIFNEGYFSNKLFATATPLYSFGNKTIVGTGEISYPIHLSGIIKKIVPYFSVRRFSYFQNLNQHFSKTYTRLAPSLHFSLRNNSKCNCNRRRISLSHEIIQTQNSIYKNGKFQELENIINQYSHIRFFSHLKNGIKNIQGMVGLEFAQYDNFDLGNKKYLKLSGYYQARFKYRRNKNFKIGAKGGYFLMNDARFSSSFNNGLVLGSLSASGTGRNDYAFRNIYFGRNEIGGWAQQIYPGNAGLKIPTTNGPYGHSNDWMLGINLDIDLPIKLPTFMAIRPYFDIALYGAPKDQETTQMKTMYSGGLQLDIKVIQVNFPIINNKKLKSLLNQRNNGNYFGLISFSMNLNRLNPKSILALSTQP